MKQHPKSAEVKAANNTIEKAYARMHEIERAMGSNGRDEPNSAGGIGSTGNRSANVLNVLPGRAKYQPLG